MGSLDPASQLDSGLKLESVKHNYALLKAKGHKLQAPVELVSCSF